MEIRHAVLRGFDAGTYTATVELDGSIASYLVGVKVARNIDSAEMTAARSVAVLFFDPADPRSAVIFAIWT